MEEDSPDVAGLLHRARERDPAALEALVDHLYPAVMAVVHRRGPREADPQDLGQETFLKILAGLARFRGGPESLEPWARRIAFRTCLNAWRHRKVRPELRWSDLPPEQAEVLDRATASESPHPVQAIAARELLESLLAQLTPEERLVIQLVDLEQLDLGRVRELTGWNAVNLRVRRFRARQKLRRALDRLRREDRDV